MSGSESGFGGRPEAAKRPDNQPRRPSEDARSDDVPAQLVVACGGLRLVAEVPAQLSSSVPVGALAHRPGCGSCDRASKGLNRVYLGLGWLPERRAATLARWNPAPSQG